MTPILALAACHGRGPQGTPGPVPTVTDTGWFTSTTPGSGECTGTIVQTEPTAGDAKWFWRDAPHVIVSVADPTMYAARLFGPSGQEVPTTVSWADDGLNFSLLFDGGLQADADHVLELTDCNGKTDIPFHTDVYGLPLVDGPATLTDHTWQLDLQDAHWLEPEGLGPLLALNFTTPVLVGASFVSADLIDLIGAPGVVDLGGNLVQDLAWPTWDFPITDFSDAPFVHAEADQVILEFEGVEIPVTSFTFETTFAPDGTSLGGTRLEGTADTRNLGVFTNDPGNENAVCDLALTLGTVCIPCEDGNLFCLPMSVEDVDATLVPGIVLQDKS